MQRNIRYVGIEIGIGGLQPHSADDVFRNRYGDCKDKATLLRAMLESVGIHSTWVLVDTRRGFVDPQNSSIDGNHAIAAIEIPAGYTNTVLQSVVTTKSGTRYLIFDPTNEWIPIGQIPPYEQGGYGILTEGNQSQLIALSSHGAGRRPHRPHHPCTARCRRLARSRGRQQRFGYSAERPRVTFTEGSQQQQWDYLEKRLRRDLEQRLHREIGRGTLHRSQPAP